MMAETSLIFDVPQPALAGERLGGQTGAG